MSTARTTALLTALVLTLSWSGVSLAQSTGNQNDAAIDHIERLEQMLRDAGVQPPARPGSLAAVSNVEDLPILPPSFATAVFETETLAINERNDKAATAIQHIRRWIERDDVKRRVAAKDIMKTLTAWAEAEINKINASSDPVASYVRADNAINLLQQDPLAMPFKRYMQTLQRDRSAYRGIVALAAYQDAIKEAQDVGLLDDWELIDFQNTNVRLTIKAITAKLTLITNTWPKSDAAESAQAKLDDWAAREAQAVADLPAYRYTWQMDLIETGTKTRTTIITQADGSVFVSENQRQLYDQETVMLYGTFQNTSDKSYRYTFVAGVTAGNWPKTPFTKLKKTQLIGYELIQTPLLRPGELHNWQAPVHVGSIRNLHRGGVTMVEISERNAGREEARDRNPSRERVDGR